MVARIASRIAAFETLICDPRAPKTKPLSGLVVSGEGRSTILSSAAIIHGAIRISGARMSFGAIGDGDLLVRLQRRDPQALAELYDRYGAAAYRLILRIVGDAHLAEDVVQETFVRVWDRARDMDPKRSVVGPWLLAVARNRAIHHLRARRSHGRSAADLDVTEDPALFVDFPISATDFDLMCQMKVTFERMSGREREALELVYFEGLGFSEVAERMDAPVADVKAWISSGFQQIRAVMSAGGTVKQ